MMMTAMAISPMMRNVLSVATILPTVVMASDMARIAPTIVPMIRRMSPVCAPGPLAGYGRAGPSRMRRWAPQRPLEQPRFAQCKPPAMLTAGDSSRAGTGNMCVRIADIEAVDKLRRFGDRSHARSRWITICHFCCYAASVRQAVPAGSLFAGAPCRSGVAQ